MTSAPPGQAPVQRFASDRRGAVSIEFAMVAAVFLTIVLIILDLGRAFWTKATMQSVAEEVARCYAVQKPQNDTSLACSSNSKAVDYGASMASARGISLATKATDLLIYDATVSAEKIAADTNCGGTTTMVYVYLKVGYTPILPFDFMYPNNQIEGKACYPII